jgi:Ni,Fe-hydrogenase maturation factor
MTLKKKKIQDELTKNVDIIDLGTGGFHLLSYLKEYEKSFSLMQV